MDANAPGYPFLLVFYIVAGFANGILITLPGVYVTQVSGESSHHDQNILYSFFSLGVVAGPLLTALIIHDNNALWRWAFRAPALLVIPMALPVALVSLQKLEGVRAISRANARRILQVNKALFYGLLVAIMLYIAAESAVSMWLITFLKDEHGLSLGIAHWVLTGLWIGITVGRWVLSPVLKRTDPFYTLAFLSIAAGATLLVAPLAASKGAVIVLYPLVGLFYSCIYPILVGYTSRFPRELSSLVFTLFLAVGAAGSAVLPYTVGLLDQSLGLVVGMCSISLLLFGVAGCVYWLRGRVLEREAKPAAVEAGLETEA